MEKINISKRIGNNESSPQGQAGIRLQTIVILCAVISSFLKPLYGAKLILEEAQSHTSRHYTYRHHFSRPSETKVSDRDETRKKFHTDQLEQIIRSGFFAMTEFKFEAGKIKKVSTCSIKFDIWNERYRVNPLSIRQRPYVTKKLADIYKSCFFTEIPTTSIQTLDPDTKPTLTFSVEQRIDPIRKEEIVEGMSAPKLPGFISKYMLQGDSKRPRSSGQIPAKPLNLSPLKTTCTNRNRWCRFHLRSHSLMDKTEHS